MKPNSRKMRKQWLKINLAAERKAPAKLNLTLHVLGRRPDGYHLLSGLTAFCRFGDDVRIRFGADRDRITVAGRFAAAVNGPNTVERALALYRELSGWPDAVAIHVDKRIPVSAGLGGGSSDAASLLLLLQRHAPRPLEEDRLVQLGLQIGADVPVCLAGRASEVGGIGEIVRPLAEPAPAWPIVLVNPLVPVSSATVFQKFRGPFSAPEGRMCWRRIEQALSGSTTHLPNDLTATTCMVAPEVGAILRSLASRPGLCAYGMSGSGGTCFGIFAVGARSFAESAAQEFSEKGWWSVHTGLLQ